MSGLGETADFGRGVGDPLGGPTIAETRIEPDLFQARIEFKVKRQNWALQTVVLTFTDPQGEAEEHLMALWRIWHGEAVARTRIAGGAGDVPLG